MNKLKYFLGIVITLTAQGFTPVLAQEIDVSSCVSIDNDIARLTCYDNLAKDTSSNTKNSGLNKNSSGIESKSPDNGIKEGIALAFENSKNWIRKEEIDPITDSLNLIFYRLPSETPRNKFGTKKSVFLYIRCVRNTTSVFISFDDFQLKDTIPVTYRIDEKQPVYDSWSISTTREDAGIWAGSNSIPFLKSLIGSKKIVIRLDLDDAVETYTFNTENIPQYLEEVSKACGWRV